MAFGWKVWTEFPFPTDLETICAELSSPFNCTSIFVGENSVFTLDTAQKKGVDSTVRETNVELGKDAKLYVTERLMTDGEQKAESNIFVTGLSTLAPVPFPSP